MSVLTATGLGKSYGAQDVFTNLSLEIPGGAKIALVGPNGSGKTTLLRLIAGLEPPSAGVVHRAKGLRIGYLPQQADFTGHGTLWEAMLAVFTHLQAQAQELRRLEAEMADPARRDAALARYGPLLERFEAAGGYTYKPRTAQVLGGLGFGEDDRVRPLAQLSGGQKTRALLARLLLEDPDLLLLDEPTNHLDLAGIEWLERYLREWPGALVVVAHDRAFLDALVNRVWELAWGRLEGYRGNYTHYVQQRAERIARRQSEYERQQEHITRTETFIRRYIAGQRTKEAQGRRKRLERLEEVERPQEYRPLSLDLGEPVRSGDLVLGLYDLTVGYDSGLPLFACQEVELQRGQRVALLGPNGSGKTTLLRTLLGQMPPLAGRVRVGASVHLGYLAQGYEGLDPEQTVLDHILAAREMPISRARNLLGRYRFSGNDVFKRVGDLSGGEQARVALAMLALQGANVLLLDEPTNHLDLPSQEVLEEVLAGFGGTLLLVTHDRYLIRNLTTRVWAIAEGRLWDFEEGYEQYREWREERRRGQGELKEPRETRERSAQEREEKKAAQREAARRVRQQAELEAAIQRLEQRLGELTIGLELASEARAVERVRELGLEFEQVQAELDSRLAEWAEVSS